MAAATPNMSRAPATKRPGCAADARCAGGLRAALCLNRPGLPDTLFPNVRGETMKQIRIGDITIDAVIEREGPWRRPQDFFPAYEEAGLKHHLPSMDPEGFGG